MIVPSGRLALLLPPLLALACAGPTSRAFGTSSGESALLLADPYEIAPGLLELEGDWGEFTPHLQLREIEPHLYEADIEIMAEEPGAVPRFQLGWDLPSVDLAGFWNTNLGLDRVNYYRNSVESRATSGAPVLALYNPAGLNRITVAASEGLNPVQMRSWVREEDARLHFLITFASEPMPLTTAYRVQVRIDTRSLPYYEALGEVSRWWEALPGYEPAPVPDAALTPLYSTWYSFHQNLAVEEVLAELRAAAEMGFAVVIVDDGWQTLDSHRGYRFTGDWEPERIPDMKGFVDAVHALGMRFMLWYSVPLVGEASKAYGRFRGKYLRHWESQGAYVLDPRYPEVREYIIDTYLRAMERWGLDGFKLDFIGMFAATDSTVLTAEGGRDYASVNEATDRLMTDIMATLRARNPEVLIEFRQPYIGPLMRKYGNMFRGVDAPNNAWANRAEVTDVRLIGGTTAPHSDMFMWHPEEPVEAAALQFLNVLFAVPQLSVRISRYPSDHREMVAEWTRYWKENRAILLRGRFRPSLPGAVYPVLLAEAEGKAIAGIYDDMVAELPDADLRAVDLVNAKRTQTVVADFQRAMGPVSVRTFDTRGRLVEEETANLSEGLYRFRVPPSGRVEIRAREP